MGKRSLRRVGRIRFYRTRIVLPERVVSGDFSLPTLYPSPLAAGGVLPHPDRAARADMARRLDAVHAAEGVDRGAVLAGDQTERLSRADPVVLRVLRRGRLSAVGAVGVEFVVEVLACIG